ncbi:hypothetical protein BCR41DRAFT_2955 [Lobosporangium transversale]|uniref:Uncharacterized protein n=1 Tax=Lobosporangium transversale TaxID=64571 RepID=A0A1Y2H4Q9_9FUNG|nr:hypothetical protein BCR41DRAFT_2955 [Lobosporangium transversale]ORZ28703.1 hypothetical protein BCR41DRAFT_2955 [Lobosporangium transversale]|eukprot:XP_021886376.1 hypothetical protein BCR41DRAFT_2955 [Lobosporangium transversale]
METLTHRHIYIQTKKKKKYKKYKKKKKYCVHSPLFTSCLILFLFLFPFRFLFLFLLASSSLFPLRPVCPFFFFFFLSLLQGITNPCHVKAGPFP